MKKILIILVGIIGTISSLFYVFADQSVQVTAIVGSINHSPVIVNVSPSSDPKLLGKNKIQNYALYFRDDEKDTTTYTITPQSGYTNPIDGIVNSGSYDSNSGAYINFTYLAPTTTPTPNPTKVTITLSYGTGFIYKDVNLYIY